MTDPFAKTLRDLLGDDPRGLDIGDLADKPLGQYTADDWRQAIPMLQESTDLLRAAVAELDAGRRHDG